MFSPKRANTFMSNIRLLSAAGVALVAAVLCSAAELSDLKVLYVGNIRVPRAAQFQAFLNTNVARVELAERVGFDPARARGFDVVLLEWPQSESQGEGEFPPKKSPLGPLAEWSTPIILLGSAGLHVAILWDVKGGFG
jgi:hypothetical protein